MVIGGKIYKQMIQSSPLQAAAALYEVTVQAALREGEILAARTLLIIL